MHYGYRTYDEWLEMTVADRLDYMKRLASVIKEERGGYVGVLKQALGAILGTRLRG